MDVAFNRQLLFRRLEILTKREDVAIDCAQITNKFFIRGRSTEKLVGDLAGLYSRRINIQHRIVYQVHHEEQVVKVIRMWTHYE